MRCIIKSLVDGESIEIATCQFRNITRRTDGGFRGSLEFFANEQDVKDVLGKWVGEIPAEPFEPSCDDCLHEIVCGFQEGLERIRKDSERTSNDCFMVSCSQYLKKTRG